MLWIMITCVFHLSPHTCGIASRLAMRQTFRGSGAAFLLCNSAHNWLSVFCRQQAIYTESLLVMQTSASTDTICLVEYFHSSWYRKRVPVWGWAARMQKFECSCIVVTVTVSFNLLQLEAPAGTCCSVVCSGVYIESCPLVYPDSKQSDVFCAKTPLHHAERQKCVYSPHCIGKSGF